MARVFPGVAMAFLWMLLLLFAPFLLFWTILAVIGALALAEYVRMVGIFPGSGGRVLVIAGMLLPLVGALIGIPEGVMAGLLAGFLVILGLTFQNYTRLDSVLSSLSQAGFGLLWLGLGLAHLALIWFLPHGNGWLLVLSSITAGSDTGAYYGGKFFGRSKLCPVISPGKTVAGAVGGMAAGVAAAVLGVLLFYPEASLIRLVGLTPMLVAVGIMGDLTESIVKRASGVKESGAILAGHGGILDRMDSLLLTAPVLYYLIRFGMLQ